MALAIFIACNVYLFQDPQDKLAQLNNHKDLQPAELMENIIFSFDLPQNKKGPRPLENGVEDVLAKSPELLCEIGHQEFLWTVIRQHSVSGLFDIDDRALQVIPSEFK